MKGYTVESAFKVYDDDFGSCIEVRESLEFPDNVLVHTPTKEDKEYYGEIHMDMPLDLAKGLVECLQKQINAIEERK